eukprot:6657708-Pyramimonas_sp.AAC.1
MTAGKGENYAAAVEASGLDRSGVSRLFKHGQRVVRADGGGAIARAERFFSVLDPGQLALHNKCHVHRAVTAKHDAFSLRSGLIRSLTHTALALAGPSCMLKFRRIVGDIVMMRLNIVRGTLPRPRVVAQSADALHRLSPGLHDITATKRGTIIL